MGIQGIYDRLGKNRGTPFTTFAIHYMQVSSGAVQMLHLQGGYFRDTETAACHQPEKGGFSQRRGCSQQPVPFV
jgi:hypothetical protein